MSRDPTTGSVPDLSRLRQCFRCRVVFVVYDPYEDGCPFCDQAGVKP